MAKKKSAKQLPPIQWTPKKVLVKDIKPTEKNYKIKTALGQERLKTSLTKFGIAGTVIVNTDLMLIDGNSRLEEERNKKSKYMWVSYPSRKLQPQEFKEMCAMYDYAVAGDIDFESIDKDLGSEKKFFEDWGRVVPKELLDKMGKGAAVELAYPDETKQGKDGKPMPVSDIRMIQVFFSSKQEKAFREMEEVIKKKFKVDNTTDVVFKAMQYATKGR